MYNVKINGRLNPGRLKTFAIKCSIEAEIKKARKIKTIAIPSIRGVISKKNPIAAPSSIPLNP